MATIKNNDEVQQKPVIGILHPNLKNRFRGVFLKPTESGENITCPNTDRLAMQIVSITGDDDINIWESTDGISLSTVSFIINFEDDSLSLALKEAKQLIEDGNNFNFGIEILSYDDKIVTRYFFNNCKIIGINHGYFSYAGPLQPSYSGTLDMKDIKRICDTVEDGVINNRSEIGFSLTKRDPSDTMALTKSLHVTSRSLTILYSQLNQ